MIFNGPSSEKLVLERISPANCQLLKQQLPSELTLLWIKAASKIIVDGRGLELSPDQLICMTEFHRLEVDSVPDALMIRFNRAFFCILDHDSAVGCKGILFFGFF